jgi:hypothetical protein
MGILSLWERLTGGTRAPLHPRADEAVERVVQVANPKLRLVPRYRARLSPAVSAALGYVGNLVAALPPAREASAAGWAEDPYIHAFFATAGDIARAFSRASDLRAHFDRNPGTAEAYAVLGMEMTERRVLGVALEGGLLRNDVAQTTVGFGDHRIRICGVTEAALRDEIERRLLDQLALEGLSRAAADQSRRTELAKEQALLKTRLRLLERQGAGMRSALAGEAPQESELGRLHAQVEANTQELSSLAIGPQLLDAELERLCQILADPAQHLYVSGRSLRLDQMNVIVEDRAHGGTAFEFQVARVPGDPPVTRAFALVRFPRAELLAPGHLSDEAARLLA